VLLLASTSDKLQVITGSAVNVDVHASWIDLAAGVVTAGRTNSKITTATTTDVVAPPAASTTRNVKTLHIGNVHASSSVLVTIQHTDGTNVIVLETVTLLAGERIAYVEGQGFEYIDATGVNKHDPIPVGSYLVQRLSADVSNSTTTAAKVTGLDLACGAGTWLWEYFLVFQSATSTVGPKLSVNHSGTVTTFLQQEMYLSGLTVDSTGVIDQDVVVPQVMAGMAKRVKDATGTMIVTAGVDTINADTLIQITGLAVVTVAGNLELWHASETATATTVKANSILRLTKIG
jgi:hypothetical protein